MQDGSVEGYRRWEELIPDALALIFKKLSFQEILTVIPVVCKSWRKLVAGPDCWQEIDIEDWCRRCNPEVMEKMVKMLVTRSRGCLHKLSVYGLRNDRILSFIAQHAQSLQTLRLPMSEVTDVVSNQVAPRLATVTYLDISCCEKMTSLALEAFGKHCKGLTRLSRNMHPQEAARRRPNDDEAFAIAEHMSNLKHLELAYGLLTDAGMEAILNRCQALEHLDIRGCWNVIIEDRLAEQCHKLKVFMGPVVNDCYELDDYHSDDDDSDSTFDVWGYDIDIDDYVSDDGAWDEDFEGVQLRLYDSFNDTDDSSDWPTSPKP